jgi:hypothetical protein
VPSSRRPPDPDPPVFFLDRGLGKHHVAAMLTARGFTAVLMSEVFPDDGQHVGDGEWIDRASDEGWVALSKDGALVRDHVASLEASTIRVFALPSSNLTGPEMAERYETNLHRIIQRARKPGPFVDTVHPTRLERRWPPDA